ncbi:MAG TPA: polysaccharide deacetylase family protein [Armatimonadota bacterium]|nr:polysaccharide deacetylase family protein [Armatimonadota bacterium]
MSRICVGFTMDCEQLNEDSAAGGPRDWGVSERAIVGFADVLERRGFRATFFAIPQTAARHARLFLALEARGFELGLHLHTLDQGWRDHLGGLAPEEQHRALSQASAAWAEALGREPQAFRAGNFSANDQTFPLLSELGFTHASTSSPERTLVGVRAVWAGALPYPHWTHAGNRLLEGDLPLLEVPITTHPTARHETAPGVPWELRVEGGQWEHNPQIIAAHLDWQISSTSDGNRPEAEALLACVAFTHNTREYSDPQDEMTKRLVRVMNALEQEGERRQIPLEKTTIGGIHRIATRASGE